MIGKSKLLLSAASAMILGATFAHGRALPSGPEWYLDDQFVYRSIRSDWPGLTSQRGPRITHAHRRGTAHRQPER
jgi:hypothetical protein